MWWQIAGIVFILFVVYRRFRKPIAPAYQRDTQFREELNKIDFSINHERAGKGQD